MDPYAGQSSEAVVRAHSTVPWNCLQHRLAGRSWPGAMLFVRALPAWQAEAVWTARSVLQVMRWPWLTHGSFSSGRRDLTPRPRYGTTDGLRCVAMSAASV